MFLLKLIPPESAYNGWVVQRRECCGEAVFSHAVNRQEYIIPEVAGLELFKEFIQGYTVDRLGAGQGQPQGAEIQSVQIDIVDPGDAVVIPEIWRYGDGSPVLSYIFKPPVRPE